MKQHFHHNVELVYFIKGHFIAYVNGIASEIYQDSLFLINSNQVHHFEMLEDCEMITTLLSYDMLKNYEPNIDNICFDLSLCLNKHSELKKLIFNMDQYRKSSEPYKEIKVQEYLCSIYYLLLHYFQKPHVSYSVPSQLENMQIILEYIENNYNQPITIEQLSEKFHYSSSYLCRFFKKNCNMSVFQYKKMLVFIMLI